MTTSVSTSAMTDPNQTISLRLLEDGVLNDRLSALTAFYHQAAVVPLTRHPRWLQIFRDGMKHRSIAIEAVHEGQTVGCLPLVLLKSRLFGKRLVSMPYVNTSGVSANTAALQQQLVAEAIKLSDQLGVKSLELRHEVKVDHPSLSEPAAQKIHMRLDLPGTSELLWKSFDPKVRNQVRKGEKNALRISWGTHDQLPAFYEIFAKNMRDLGTPVFGQILFRSILTTFPDAELCVVRQGDKPLAAALLLHGKGITEVPSASSLREYNSTCANMLMYWHLLQRAISREQATFDFGRSSPDSPTHQFKKQWGAKPFPAVWQYYVRKGSASDMRPDNPKFRLMIRTWKKLPIWLTRLIGPSIARVIP